MLTTEQLRLLQKFGFQVESHQVKHVKTGLSFSIEEIAKHPSNQELEAALKTRLKNQCLLKKRPHV